MSLDEIKIVESVYARNEKLADELNTELTANNVFAINVMGAPGAGKTSTIINILKHLDADSFVIEGDIESDIDSKKLAELGIKTYQINTGGACHLDTPVIKKVADEKKFKDCVLFIENIGNLVCPAEFLIGEHIKMLICTVTEGSDKPYKYPLAFEKADVIIINKCDLCEYVSFDEEFFMKGVRALNSNVPVFKVSATKEFGFEELTKWISKKKESFIKQ